MRWNRVIIDALMSYPESDTFCFCPFDDDGTIVTGMNWLQGSPPAGCELVGVWHEGGDEAARSWVEAHRDSLERLKERI